MPKFQNKSTRSIVDVDEGTAATLGREWAPLETAAAAKGPKPRRTASRPADAGSEE